MKRIHKIFATSTATLALVVATAVTAAPYGMGGGCDGTGAGPGPGMGMMHGGMGPGYGGRQGGGVAQGTEPWLAQMKTRLAITAAQEPAWQAYASLAADQASQMQATWAQHRQAMGADSTAPAMMSLRIGMMTQRLAAMQALNGALTDLYAVLSPEQRATADRSLGGMGPMGYGRGMRG